MRHIHAPGQDICEWSGSMSEERCRHWRLVMVGRHAPFPGIFESSPLLCARSSCWCCLSVIWSSYLLTPCIPSTALRALPPVSLLPVTHGASCGRLVARANSRLGGCRRERHEADVTGTGARGLSKRFLCCVAPIQSDSGWCGLV